LLGTEGALTFPTMTEVLKDDLARRFATRAVHAGQVPDPLAGAVMTPI